MAKAIMIQGTMSNSGKSFLTAGLCRVFKQDGYKVAPFKSQNMALNSYITKDGLEIGRAQAMQAEACGIDPTVEMNPILLKPTSNVGSQVIVNGEVRGNMKAMDYYRNKKQLVPDVMAACGAVLREVGSTNKTRLSDYANAIGAQTRALLKVHTSNYRIVGFTESESPAALAELGRSCSIPVIEDLGSGCLIDLAPLGLRDEPTVQASVRGGVDVLSFSGDKLLGGPQAGIIVGKRRCIDLLKRHPLARALRVDKLTLAALEATLQAYADGTALQEIPVLSMLAQTPEELRQQAESLCRRLEEIGVTAEVVSTETPVGGGAVPTQTLPSFAVAVAPRDSAAALETQLRQRPVPIIVRIAHDRCLLDMRTLFPADLDEILQAFRETAS